LEGVVPQEIPHLEVDTPTLAFTITRPGDYRIDTNPNTYETYVTVRNGEGQVTGNAGTFGVHAGEQAAVTGQDGAQLNMYWAPNYDDFDLGLGRSMGMDLGG
jgi:hypothetical protein